MASPRQIGITPLRRPLSPCFCTPRPFSSRSLLALLLSASRCCPSAGLARCSRCCCRSCRLLVPRTCPLRWWALPSLLLILLLPPCLSSRSCAPPARSLRLCPVPPLPPLQLVNPRRRLLASPHRPLLHSRRCSRRRAGGLAPAAPAAARAPPSSAASPLRRSSRASPSSAWPGSATGRSPACALSQPGVGRPTPPPPACVVAGALLLRPAPCGYRHRRVCAACPRSHVPPCPRTRAPCC